MNKLYIKLILLCIAIIGVVVLLIFVIRDKPESSAKSDKPTIVNSEIYGLGTIEAKTISSISFEIGARLIELNVDQGDKVVAGNLLARLDNSKQAAKTEQAAAVVNVAKNRLKKAQLTIPKMKAILAHKTAVNKRAQGLLLQHIVSEEGANKTKMEEEVAAADLKIAENEAKLVEAELRDAQTKYNYEKTLLKQYSLLAPYDGVVVKRHKELGEVVLAGQPVFTIVNPETIWILSYIDEARAGNVKLGQLAKVRLRSISDKKFTGKVVRIDLESDRVNEERRVYVHCNTCPKQLYLGEQAEVFIQLEQHDITGK